MGVLEELRAAPVPARAESNFLNLKDLEKFFEFLLT